VKLLLLVESRPPTLVLHTRQTQGDGQNKIDLQDVWM
jgi:hypothetical protein